jgi:hypothetical protein
VRRPVTRATTSSHSGDRERDVSEPPFEIGDSKRFI